MVWGLMDVNKLYFLIGKILCGLAGAIVGYLFGGIVFAIPALVAGFAAGYVVETRLFKLPAAE